MFQISTLEPKNQKKISVVFDEGLQILFLQKSASGLLYSRFLPTLRRIRSTELLLSGTCNLSNFNTKAVVLNK